MAEMLQMPDPKNPFAGIPQVNPNMVIAQNTERIAIGLDMLVGILAEKWEMDLKEAKDDHGNTVLRWRPRGAETTDDKTQESTDREA